MASEENCMDGDRGGLCLREEEWFATIKAVSAIVYNQLRQVALCLSSRKRKGKTKGSLRGEEREEPMGLINGGEENEEILGGEQHALWEMVCGSRFWD